MTSTPDFSTFSKPHLVAIGLTFLVPLLLSLLVRQARSDQLTRKVCYSYVAVLLGQEFAMFGWRLVSFGWTGQEGLLNHLPFHLCGILVFLISVMLILRDQNLYEIAYFCGLVGTLNALIFPNLVAGEGFPSFRFIQYFSAHSSIIGSVLFATWGLQLRPTLNGLLRAFIVLNLYTAFTVLINLILRNWVPESNYMFVCAPPENAPQMFFFLPHPWYILFLDVLSLILFFVVYLPFAIVNLFNRIRASEPQN